MKSPISFKLVMPAFLFSMFLFLQSCSKEENNLNSNGEFELSMTDAPIDDPEIEGAFITVTAIELDGTRFNLENSQTFDIMSYQKGKLRSLLNTSIKSGTYSKLAVVLDVSQKNGEPACYVQTKDGRKHNLFTGFGGELKMDVQTEQLEIRENSKLQLVCDFNVRTAVRSSTGSDEDKYNISTDFSSIIRAQDMNSSVNISGKISDPLGFSDSRTVVYLYKKGTFNQDSETSQSGSNGIMFKNALSSDVTDFNGNFGLSYLPSNEYELILVAYENKDSDSELEVKGFLTGDVLGLLGIKIDARGTTDINTNIAITGFLGI